eukprot:gnl/TRDRNA2_/TRDRNA2_159007_c1_seq2.p1 gnl/TRDRNA2_/TRDRNA2_159007_c1~~gnl/TRDRNA2_/TRDRNA2_159007_c1_seq2.p1  ORF type:complete len:186 (+),score=13.29 gnl/TRDRNA2_/TRDRNA2_159007_c1_seq2:20-577(+)
MGFQKCFACARYRLVKGTILYFLSYSGAALIIRTRTKEPLRYSLPAYDDEEAASPPGTAGISGSPATCCSMKRCLCCDGAVLQTPKSVRVFAAPDGPSPPSARKAVSSQMLPRFSYRSLSLNGVALPKARVIHAGTFGAAVAAVSGSGASAENAPFCSSQPAPARCVPVPPRLSASAERLCDGDP